MLNLHPVVNNYVLSYCHGESTNTNDSQWVCVTALIFFQDKMSELFAGFDYIRAYIDDLLVITKGSLQDPLEKFDAVFKRLNEAGLRVNAKKSFFGQSEVEYLGYMIGRHGIRPVAKKVEAIHKIKEPKNKRELQHFIGIVNYYRDMWIRRSHVLAPLTELTSKQAKW